MLTSTKKKKLKISNFSNPYHPQADCFLSPTKFSFDFKIFGFTNWSPIFPVFFFYILNVKQKFKVDAPMQIFPLWSPKILPLNLIVFF